MQRFKIEQSSADIISHSGLSLIGQAIKNYTTLSHDVDALISLRHGIKQSNVVKSYLGLLSTGKNDFEAINTIESDFYFMSAMDIQEIPSEATLRQRMDKHAVVCLPVVEKASVDFLSNIQPRLSPLDTGHIPLDADVTPMDNSGSHKEGVSRTYKGHDGFAPMAVYLGQEGYCLGFELREGKQHCQKDTPALLEKALQHAQQITHLTGNSDTDTVSNTQFRGLHFHHLLRDVDNTIGRNFTLEWTTEGRGNHDVCNLAVCFGARRNLQPRIN